MTRKELEMFELIRENPQISQNELAEKLNITRSSVSVHISNLSKKGYISGRGYIVNQPDYVTVVGGANIDILGNSTNKIILEDSNPGHIKLCAGGVGRNIAENLARLSVNVKLISCLGDDTFSKKIMESCEPVGIDMSHCYIKEGGSSSTYIAILDEGGEMKLALSDLSILDELPIEHINKKQQLLKGSKIIVLDANLPESMLEYILANFKDNKFYLDPVSIGKSKHVKNLIGHFDTIKLNTLEAEFLSDMTIKNRDSLERVGEYFLNKGVNRILLSMGKDGVFYKTPAESGIVASKHITPVNATGAGDAFMAGIVYCSLLEKTNEYTARFSTAMARIALMSESTVSPLMNVDKIIREMKN